VPADAARMDELTRILAQFDADAQLALRRLRTLNSCDPAGFARLALAHLGGGGTGPAERGLAQLLTPSREYMRLLTDPDSFSVAEARAAAAIMARVDHGFHGKLLEMQHTGEAHRTLRILEIMGRDERSIAMTPWLRELVDDHNPQVASKAAMVLSWLTRNPMAVGRFLQSSDARVRANAVEGLWGGRIENTRGVLRAAAGDSHHRVAANALVELCRCGDPVGREKIEELACHADPRFRGAIAWAIGEIGDPRLLPIVRALECDPNLKVRLRAGRTAKRLLGAAAGAIAPPPTQA